MLSKHTSSLVFRGFLAAVMQIGIQNMMHIKDKACQMQLLRQDWLFIS